MFNHEPSEQLAESDREKWELPDEQNDDGVVNLQAKRDEGKYGKQPAIEDEFVNLAISQTGEDFDTQETIHLIEQQVHDEGDFVSLRSANKVRNIFIFLSFSS